MSQIRVVSDRRWVVDMDCVHGQNLGASCVMCTSASEALEARDARMKALEGHSLRETVSDKALIIECERRGMMFVGTGFRDAIFRLMEKSEHPTGAFSDSQFSERVESLLRLAEEHRRRQSEVRPGPSPLEVTLDTSWRSQKAPQRYAVEFSRPRGDGLLDRVFVGYEHFCTALPIVPRGITAGMSPEAGQGITKLVPQENEPMSFLDEDLLCDDA